MQRERTHGSPQCAGLLRPAAAGHHPLSDLRAQHFRSNRCRENGRMDLLNALVFFVQRQQATILYQIYEPSISGVIDAERTDAWISSMRWSSSSSGSRPPSSIRFTSPAFPEL